MKFPDYRIADAEERALAFAVQCKTDVMTGLAMAAEARKARGADTTGIEETLEYERMTLAGITRALENRRKQIRQLAGEVR